jgi:hypothetical protein
MFVGGEFYYESRWLVDNPTISTPGMVFLNGGKACLVVIGDYLRDHAIHSVLLPSYLCPSIVNTLEQCGLACTYYQINADFSIDLQDLSNKVSGCQAVYLINYFGFLHSPQVRNYLTDICQKGTLVIEDNAQAGFPTQSSGDFSFNSIRKLAPYDGGYLTTALQVTPYVKKYHGIVNRRLPLIRAYREQLSAYLFQGAACYDTVDQYYQRAEQYYDSDLVVEGDDWERRQIERLDWQEIRQRRRENYAYLLTLIAGMGEITPVFPVLQEDIMPLGLPVYVSGVSRDGLADALGNVGIGLTIHWQELLTDTRLNGNRVAFDMASKILTLVIDQRTSHKQLDYQAQQLMDCIQKMKMS